MGEYLKRISNIESKDQNNKRKHYADMEQKLKSISNIIKIEDLDKIHQDWFDLLFRLKN